MEVAYPEPILDDSFHIMDANRASGTMHNADMDIDMDIDLRPVDEDFHSIVLNTEQNLTSSVDGGSSTDPMVSEQQHKIHIRGLDDLTTNDIQAFSVEHCPSHPPDRIEWVDDTSANIVFDSAATALQALEDFTLPDKNGNAFTLPALELRNARTLSSHPNSKLLVRTALSTDQKRPRAYEASRFYMMHPEHDPRENRRRGGPRQKHSDEGDRRRRYSDEEQRRRRRRDGEEGFNPSMYDDNGTSSRQNSMDLSASDRAHSPRHRSRFGRDSYRPDRDRSASPIAERNGEPRRRRRTPPPAYKPRDPYPFPSDNKGKELFPSRAASDGDTEKKSKELFSNRLLAVGLKKELFPSKAKAANHHRRSDAFDAADETADLFANGLSVPFSDGHQNSKSLADPIPSGSVTASYGRLKASNPDSKARDNGDISIRGASSQQGPGFLIRGGAAAGTIKELFPGKAMGNGGKELFAEKLQGRGGRRNRAEDMFH